jgi:hypothetical protein
VADVSSFHGTISKDHLASCLILQHAVMLLDYVLLGQHVQGDAVAYSTYLTDLLTYLL